MLVISFVCRIENFNLGWNNLESIFEYFLFGKKVKRVQNFIVKRLKFEFRMICVSIVVISKN